MTEVLVDARERFLKPGGKIFPRHASVWLAPFEDEALHDSRCQRVAFWDNPDYLGVDLTPLADTAYEELFEMPALGPVSPALLMAAGASWDFDFQSLSREQLARIQLPFEFQVTRDGLVHGLAGWFDVTFDGSLSRVVLSTAPDQPATHWAQLRFLFRRPLELRAGERFEGNLTLVANASSSYDALVEGCCSAGMRLEPQRFRLQNYFSWDRDE
jgi:histone-arginine methyltransferase CARM1